MTKKSLIEKGGAAFDKDFLATFTLAHPDVFAKFRSAEKTREVSIPIEELFPKEVSEVCNHLIAKLGNVGVGPSFATAYHRIVVSILDFLFYPYLTKPSVEQVIHQGRKRIDITFDNGATNGFFSALSNQAQIPSRFVFVECKNYGRDVGNPEIDQLSSRFSVNRGKFGLLLCRSVDNMDLLLSRCRDTMGDDRGLIIPLVDEDLIFGLEQRAQEMQHPLDFRLEDAHRRIALTGR